MCPSPPISPLSLIPFVCGSRWLDQGRSQVPKPRTDTYATPPTFSLFDGNIPSHTVTTRVRDWVKLVRSPPPGAEGLYVVKLRRVERRWPMMRLAWQRGEFLLLDVYNASTSTTFAVVVERDVEPGPLKSDKTKDKEKNKNKGYARDTLSILSANDTRYIAHVSALDTLSWTMGLSCGEVGSSPPLVDVLTMLGLASLHIGGYSLSLGRDCNRFVVLAFQAIQLYRSYSGHVQVRDSKRFGFLSAKDPEEEEDMLIDLCKVVVLFYEFKLERKGVSESGGYPGLRPEDAQSG